MGAAAAGRDAKGAGGVPDPPPGRGPGPIDDGRANGAGMPPSGCVGPDGALGAEGGVIGPGIGPAVGPACGSVAGMLPGIVGRTGVVARGASAGADAAAPGRETASGSAPLAGDAGVDATACAGVAEVGSAGGGATGLLDTLGVGVGALDTAGAGAIGVLGRIGVGATGAIATVGAGAGAGAGAAVTKSAPASLAPAMMITPPHTEQRARTLAAGIFAGSTRNTERHSEQVTFIACLPPESRSSVPRYASPPPAGCRCGGRRRRLIPPESWRSSSFPLRVH